MVKRLYISELRVGVLSLAPAQAHHAHDVLRLRPGQMVEIFDDAGATAQAMIMACESGQMSVRVDAVQVPIASESRWTIASALPKGTRGDWMVEKLCELGTPAFVPLLTRRSVVKAEGKNRLERWRRIAQEASRQSRRSGVMTIAEPVELEQVLAGNKTGTLWCMSVEPDSTSIQAALAQKLAADLTLFIGPEGGWDASEREAFTTARARFVRLTPSILRIETAAIAAAAILAVMREGGFANRSSL